LSSRKERRPREGADDGADFVARGQLSADCGFNLAALRPSLPHQAPTERAENAGIPRRRKPEEPSALDPLENDIRKHRSFAEGSTQALATAAQLRNRRL
jgi:hypothetical protein